MAKIKFPLEMANGEQVRTLGDLKDNFDIEKIVGYFLDGKLKTWLEDRYYEDESEAIASLDRDDADLTKKICDIFGIDFAETENVDAEAIAERNARLEKLKQFTDDEEIIKNIDLVAFNQEELGDLYDKGAEKIYLCEGEFNIPKSKQDLEYVEFGNAVVNGLKVEPDIIEYIAKKENDGRYVLYCNNITKGTKEAIATIKEKITSVKYNQEHCVYAVDNCKLYLASRSKENRNHIELLDTALNRGVLRTDHIIDFCIKDNKIFVLYTTNRVYDIYLGNYDISNGKRKLNVTYIRRDNNLLQSKISVDNEWIYMKHQDFLPNDLNRDDFDDFWVTIIYKMKLDGSEFKRHEVRPYNPEIDG